VPHSHALLTHETTKFRHAPRMSDLDRQFRWLGTDFWLWTTLCKCILLSPTTLFGAKGSDGSAGMR
jgi:hypothetical protein